MMTPERWQQVKRVLEGALELASDERPAFLDRACSTDHSLRREVESLLSSSNDVRSSFLKSSPNAGLRLSKGTRLGDFEILSLLGTGGMGEVYRARDCRLDRDVALKVLPRFVSFDPERLHRFEQEAKAAAALNHPNILAVFHMGTYEGAPFLVSELLEGETLREQLKHGPLPPKKAIDYGVQIVQGLAAAHEKGIVHRDLKPENLFVTTDGRIKILDFGLAKLTHPESETQLTKETLDTEPGAVLGTVGYMSPEQVRGLAADHRSDIFALGAILYEMLSGKRAFHKPTSAETMTAILNEEPLLLLRVAPNISPALGQAVHRCLEKDPGQRFQSATDLESVLPASAETQPHAPVLQTRKIAVRAALAVAALLALSALSIGLNVGGLRDSVLHGVSSPTIRSLAVLPLANLTGDSGQDYFVDGMTDELTTDLAQIAALRVTSRTSTMQFKDAKKPVPQIAKELNVEAIVEGSVVRSADRVRITAQLIEAKGDRHLWAKSYERKIEDVLALQDQVARDIAEEIRVKLTPQEQIRLASDRKTNTRAYDAYLRGRYLWSQRNAEAIARAIGYFQQAVQEDSHFALPYAGLADCYSVSWGAKHDLPLSEEYARKALSLQPDLAEGHASLGMAMLLQYKVDSAEPELRRALELNPNYAMGHHFYAGYLLGQGHAQDALLENGRARELDPFSFPINLLHGVILIGLRQYAGAVEQLEKTGEISSQSPAPHSLLARIYWLEGKAPEAIAEESKAATLAHSPERLRNQQEVANTYANSGLRAARLKAAQLMEKNYKGNYEALFIAFQYGTLEDKPKVLQWLEQSAHDHETNLLLGSKSAPEFDFLRSDPSYSRLFIRIGLPP